MPKTYNDLYENIISIENLYAAYHDARSDKRLRPDILTASSHIEEIIDNLHDELVSMKWQPDFYSEFIAKNEVKRRVINAPSFRDRILHHAIIKVVLPLFVPKFIFHSYAVTPGKGQHKSVETAQRFVRLAMKDGPVYVLQCDIHHYYESMHHDILINQISRTIRDKRLLEIWRRIICGFNGDTGTGLPIGAYTSQLSANIYLNVLDHFIKECIGWKYYLRYMDDFLLIGNDKESLWKALADIQWLLSTFLLLKLNRKTRVFKATQGIDFAGYRIFYNHILPRKRNIKAARIRFKNISRMFRNREVPVEYASSRVNSFLGYMKHCNGYMTTGSTLAYLKLKRSATCQQNLLIQK